MREFETFEDLLAFAIEKEQEAVDFYRRQGCEMALEPHPDLLAEEPDDLHLICPL